ncbi:hypothetical protein CJ030_MR6G025453 [Morella rubra]|uniref:Uncharacterized protein n=1 Tax=Morella rubra TaxID=262757 RepID=A0A6A1VEV4_9ROSI|nr:hypothetical protein CJ030_MR6G025453 [Morella rubra]
MTLLNSQTQMGKFAEDLKKGLLHMAGTIKACKTCRGYGGGEEPNKLKSSEKLSVQDRAIHTTRVARGPKRPGVTRGGGPQTN